MSDERVESAHSWLSFAIGDLESARSGGHRRPRHVAFDAQQAVEKALKAALILEDIDPPRIHDLDELRALLPTRWRVKHRPASLSKLSDYAVDPRYPDFLVPVLPLDAANAVRQAISVIRLVSEEFDRRGYSVDESR